MVEIVSAKVQNLNSFFLSLRPTFVLALLIVAVSALQPCKTTQFLPFVCIVSLFLCYNYRLIGIGLSCLATISVYFITYHEIASELKIWHAGLFLAVLVTNFITYLAKEEQNGVVNKQNEQAQELNEKKTRFEEQISALQEELEKWIEEAKLRKIEKIALEEKITLIQAEIQSFLAQKEAIIADSFEKRSQPANVLEIIARHEQLKKQFEEKSKILSETRQELFKEQGKVEVLEKKLQELEYQFSALQAQNELQVTQLQEELTALEDLINQLMSK